MKIAITGGAGFVGTHLTKYLTEKGHTILILDLKQPKTIDPKNTFITTNLIDDLPKEELLKCDAIIHLAGVNIFGKWTKEYKQLIIDSRVKTAQAIINTCKEANKGPNIFVSASAIGIYGNGGENELSITSPKGSDFLATVCKEWEQVAQSSQEAGMRWVSIRTGLVIGANGGLIKQLMPIYSFGLGGKLGSGKQWMSWIALQDLLRIYEYALMNDDLTGPINAVSPEPIRQQDFAQLLAKIIQRPAIIPLPKFVLKLFLQERSNLLLFSQKVIPNQLNGANFSFSYPTMKTALENAIETLRISK